jgi:DNA (cytosine-5)-methyltransferase 1
VGGAAGPRPRLLDLFSGAGGCSVGYQRAGFEVVGVDIEPHPDYPFQFHVADALDVLATWDLDEFDVIHASPPCHDWSDLAARSGLDGSGELLDRTRAALLAWGGRYVIENVEGAPLLGPLKLCGSEFDLWADCADGRRRQLRRHRLFESNVFLMGAGGCHHRGQPIGVYGTGGGGQMTRGYKGNLAESRQATGAHWMNRSDVSQCVPPRFTQHIGEQLLAAITEEHAA